jgi:predicted acetyltransferase
VFSGSEIVAGTGAYRFELTVPGGPVPCAGITIVAVLPTHRRRGLLRRMMRAQLADIRERGEPLAVLWASEETIYGRYGYGLSSLCQVEMRLPRAYARLRDDAPGRGEVRLVEHDEAMRAFPRVYERVRRRTVGFISRSRDWWEIRSLGDQPERRGGAGPLNRALLELDGRLAGYALYRVKSEFQAVVNTGYIRVLEAIGDSPTATRELWRFLLGIDWLGEVQASMMPLDHPLLHLVANPNRMRWLVGDGVWVRLVDVDAALAARSYAGDGRVTLEVVSDPQFPDNVGTWTVESGVARRSRRRPDVRLDVQALGSAYLGGFTFAALAAAGRAEEGARGGLARADALFRTARLPWTPENF